MILNHHDGEQSTVRQNKIEMMKVAYRGRLIGEDTFLLSLNLLGVNEREAKAEAALIRMEKNR